MNEIFVFIIETNDGNVFREYVENVLKIDERLVSERFENAIRKHRYFYLIDSGRYINVSHIITIKVEIM